MSTLTIANLSTANSTTSSSTLTISGITASIGDWLVVAVAADNAGSSGAISLSATMTDSAGNSYTNRGLFNRTAGTTSDGTTLGIFTAPVTSALSSGSITVNFSPSTTSKSAIVKRLRPGSGETVGFRSIGAGSTGSGTTTSAGAVTVNLDDTIIGFIAVEEGAAAPADTDTTSGSWTSAYAGIASTGTNSTSQAITGQEKTVTATGSQTYNVTLANTRDYSINYIIFGSDAPPGVRREYWAINGCYMQ